MESLKHAFGTDGYKGSIICPLNLSSRPDVTIQLVQYFESYLIMVLRNRLQPSLTKVFAIRCEPSYL